MESRSPWMAALPSLPAYLVPLSWKEEVGQGDGCHRIRAYLHTSALHFSSSFESLHSLACLQPASSLHLAV